MHYKGLFKLFKHFDSHFYKIISQNLMRFFQNFCDIQNCVYGPLTNQMEKFAFISECLIGLTHRYNPF